jgi:MFS family permease
VPLPAALAPLRHRSFAALWCAAFVSNIGTWMESLAVGILVTETTGRSGWAGLVAGAAFLPGFLLGPVGGALADRYPRRRLLVLTSLAQAGLAAVLSALAAAGTPSPGVVTLIAFAAGCASALGFPAYQSMLPDLVPRDEVVGAVALSSAQWNLGRILGPALAALAIGTDRYALAFALNAVSFAGVIVVVARLDLPRPSGQPQPIVAALRDGVSFVRHDRVLRTVFGFMAVNSLLAAPFIALVPPMAIEVLDAGASGTATLVTAQGVGAVTMALSLGVLVKRFGSARVLEALMVLLPLSLLAYAVSPRLVVAAPAIAVVGFFYVGCLSGITSTAQLRAPARIRGRVVATFTACLSLLYPIGSVTQGWLADHVGLRETTAGAAALLLAVALVRRLPRGGAARSGDDIDPARPIVPDVTS